MESAVHDALDAAVLSGHDVLLSVPQAYRKWGTAEIPERLANRQDITLHRPAEDFGAATKLLGALDWLPDSHSYTHILTLDDDAWYPDLTLPISVLVTASRTKKQPTVTTFGGIRLLHFPYRNKNGLGYNNVGYVDAVAGYRGVLYPLDGIWMVREEFFKLRNQLPEGIFNDDDAYFGMVLASNRIPIWAVPATISEIGLSKKSMITAPEGRKSGVATGTRIPRRDNEALLFRHAVEVGLLPSPFSPRPGLMRRALYSRVGRPIVRLARSMGKRVVGAIHRAKSVAARHC